MESLEKKLEQLVSETIDYIFVQGHSIADTKSGDATIEQVENLEKITEMLTKLLIEQVKQNL
jgi:hypothetical protein